ncbi:MAG: hypothetical protein VB106_16450 [Clostridiaceae bacterium]|nr:hypothetical protein [Clostridiaceae bacterium]
MNKVGRNNKGITLQQVNLLILLTMYNFAAGYITDLVIVMIVMCFGYFAMRDLIYMVMLILGIKKI